MNIGYIFGKALRGEDISNEEMAFVEAAAASEQVEEAVQANGILKTAGAAEQRVMAYDRLVRTCESELPLDNGRAVAILLSILERFSEEELQRRACLVPFVYQAAKQPFVGARINAMRVLRQLAGTGDERAIGVLREGLQDPDTYVRSTAKASLKLSGN